jgi:DNA-binding MarR family transcriptional regulator
MATSTNATSSDSALASTLRLSVMRLARRMRQQRAESSLTLTQVAALATVERHPGVTPGELAGREKVQPPSMTKVVAALESAGLLARTPHPTDGRQVQLRCTPEGVALLKDDRRRREAWLAQRLAELDAEEVAVLRQAAVVLDKLAGA